MATVGASQRDANIGACERSGALHGAPAKLAPGQGSRRAKLQSRKWTTGRARSVRLQYGKVSKGGRSELLGILWVHAHDQAITVVQSTRDGQLTVFE